MKVLITGATGFLGSHLCDFLVKEGHQVFATYRSLSSFDRCKAFKEEVVWINLDNNELDEKLKNIELDLFVHAAWAGVGAKERDDWELQLSNFNFSRSMIDLAIKCNAKKIVCLGSQAEYGKHNSKTTENHTPDPDEAYGAIKLLTMRYLKEIASKENIEWYWLRIFSIIGENENNSWLLSHVTERLLCDKPIDLTEGKQIYDYLYINDFIDSFSKIIYCQDNFSGIYNICSGKPTQIKRLLQMTAKKLSKPQSLLKFGALPYRPNQSMYVVGSINKFEMRFGPQKISDLNEVISNFVRYKTITK